MYQNLDLGIVKLTIVDFRDFEELITKSVVAIQHFEKISEANTTEEKVRRNARSRIESNHDSSNVSLHFSGKGPIMLLPTTWS